MRPCEPNLAITGLGRRRLYVSFTFVDKFEPSGSRRSITPVSIGLENVTDVAVWQQGTSVVLQPIQLGTLADSNPPMIVPVTYKEDVADNWRWRSKRGRPNGQRRMRWMSFF